MLQGSGSCSLSGLSILSHPVMGGESPFQSGACCSGVPTTPRAWRDPTPMQSAFPSLAWRAQACIFSLPGLGHSGNTSSTRWLQGPLGLYNLGVCKYAHMACLFVGVPRGHAYVCVCLSVHVFLHTQVSAYFLSL